MNLNPRAKIDPTTYRPYTGNVVCDAPHCQTHADRRVSFYHQAQRAAYYACSFDCISAISHVADINRAERLQQPDETDQGTLGGFA